MNKTVLLVLLFGLVCAASGHVLLAAPAYGGVKDVAGNYYDFETGQLASAADGKVYNTRPLLLPLPYVHHPLLIH